MTIYDQDYNFVILRAEPEESVFQAVKYKRVKKNINNYTKTGKNQWRKE